MMRTGTIVGLACCAAYLFSGGCVSQRSLQHKIQTARTRAYRQWESKRETGAQDLPHITGALSLDDALKLALTHNRTLHAVLQEQEVARGRVLASHSGLLPTIELLSSYTRHDGDAYDKQALGALDQYAAGITVSQPIFRGGATLAEIRAAKLYACYSDERVRGQCEETVDSVATQYYRILLANELLRVTQDAVESASAYLQDVSLKRESGMATEYDVLRARVEVALYQAEMIQQRNEVSTATAELLREMGVSQDSVFSISGELIYHELDPVFKDAVELAYRARPDLQQAQTTVYMQEEAVRLAASRFWPQVHAFFSQGWGRPDPHASLDDEWGGERAAGVSVSWTLFDGLGREGRLIEEHAVLRQRHLELLDQEEHAVFEVRKALLAIRDAEEFVESQQMNLAYAQEGLRMAEAGYRAGVNTEVDVTDARAALTRAQGLHYQAIHDHAMARLALQKVTGMLAPAAAEAVPRYDELQHYLEDLDCGLRTGGDGQATLDETEQSDNTARGVRRSEEPQKRRGT